MANEYVSAADYKAFALNSNGVNVFVAGQQNEEAAKTAALEQCQKRADATTTPRKCEIYAVGNTMVYQHGRPPVPPLPWIRHDPSTERPFASKEVPIVREPGKVRIENVYPSARKSKTLAIGPGGVFFFNSGAETIEESARRIIRRGLWRSRCIASAFLSKNGGRRPPMATFSHKGRRNGVRRQTNSTK